MSGTGRDQGVRDHSAVDAASGARPAPAAPKTGLPALVDRVLALKPARVFLHYSNDNGPLIASGMTYQAFFALAAALWLVFSLLGFALKGSTDLQISFYTAVNGFLPHLIEYTYKVGTATETYQGVIKGSDLLNVAGLSWSTAISTVGVLLTAVGFLATLRTAIRIMFALPGPKTNPVLQKLADLGLAVAFGAAVLLTALVSLVINTSLDFVLGLVGLPSTSPVNEFLLSLVGLAVIAAVDTVLVAAVMRILSGIRIPHRRLWAGAVIAGVGLALFQWAATSLLHLGTNNPALKTFATLIGVLVYFNLVCQILLIGASWVAVGMQDAGIDLDSRGSEESEVDRARRLEDARRLVADADRRALEQRVRDARGLERWRLARELQREVRAEAQRRQRVPTEAQFAAERAGTTKAADEGRARAEERPR